MREIAFDTETTGFDPREGHRVVEIGCVELKNRIRTGRTFHAYLNPEREVPEPAFKVHGLSTQFLSDKPKFQEVADAFLEFIGEAPFVIHNADFDMKFINAELMKVGRAPYASDRAFCTMVYARKKFPGAPASLDALCKRFNIDLSGRTKHGALLDAELLSDMYLELMGGNQTALQLAEETTQTAAQMQGVQTGAYRAPRPHSASPEEKEAHLAFLKKIKVPEWSS